MNFFNLSNKEKRKVVEQATDEAIKEQQIYTFEQVLEKGKKYKYLDYFKDEIIKKEYED